MKLSVIIPVYNVELYLDRCIESVLSQNIDDFEVILVDDSSTDSSGKLCDNWANSNSKIKVFHCEKNGGLSATRNIGLKIANGDYVTFVDSDDYISPNTYSGNLKLLEQNKDADSLIFPVFVYYGSLRAFKYFPGNNKINYSDWVNNGGCFYCYAWNKIYKRKLWQQINFPEGSLFEDIIAVPKVMESSKSIINSSIGMYYYCDHVGSISNRNDIKHKKAFLSALTSLFETMKNDERVSRKMLDEIYLHICNAQIVLLQLGGEYCIPKYKISIRRALTQRNSLNIFLKAVLCSLLGDKFCYVIAKLRKSLKSI